MFKAVLKQWFKAVVLGGHSNSPRLGIYHPAQKTGSPPKQGGELLLNRARNLEEHAINASPLGWARLRKITHRVGNLRAVFGVCACFYWVLCGHGGCILVFSV